MFVIYDYISGRITYVLQFIAKASKKSVVFLKQHNDYCLPTAIGNCMFKRIRALKNIFNKIK